MVEKRTRAERKAATAAAILAAAQDEFGAHGDGATIRGIARRAGVDPSLVLQHYGSKAALFSLAVRPVAEVGSGDVPDHLTDVLGARLRELPPATQALMRSMLTSPEAAATMREYLEERSTTLAAALEGDDADLRAALIVSSILGVTIARHFLELAPLTGTAADRVEGLVGSWLAPLVGGSGEQEASPGA